MNSAVIKLLAGLCVLLLLVLFAEWKLMNTTADQTNTPPSNDNASQQNDIKLPALDLNRLPVDSYADMVERPLFIKGRKPIESSDMNTNFLEVGKISDLLLLGIYTIDGHKSALFNKLGKDRKYLKKSEGDDVSGWLLKEIQSDRVILEQAGRKQTVLLRKPKKHKLIKKPRKVIPKPRPLKS